MNQLADRGNGARRRTRKSPWASRDRGGVVTRTDALGAYKVPGFGKEVSPDEVTVSWSRTKAIILSAASVAVRPEAAS